MRNIKRNFSRVCPLCGGTIWYNSKSSLNRAARAGNRPCQSCHTKSLWNGEQAPLRQENVRLRRNKSISDKRQDPDSAYNTPAYVEKQSSSKKAIRTTLPSYTSDEYKEKQSESLKKVWQTEEYRTKRLSPETLSSCSEKMKKIWEARYSEFVGLFRKSWENNEPRREATRQRFNSLLESEEFRERLWGNYQVIRVSKLELKLKNQLEKLGFQHSSVHKKHFSRYLPDFLNEETKTIVEVYGDYWHCNPNMNKPYSNPGWFHPKIKMTSADKWALDYLRCKFLEEQGYKVIVLWEHDIEECCYDVRKILSMAE